MATQEEIETTLDEIITKYEIELEDKITRFGSKYTGSFFDDSEHIYRLYENYMSGSKRMSFTKSFSTPRLELDRENVEKFVPRLKKLFKHYRSYKWNFIYNVEKKEFGVGISRYQHDLGEILNNNDWETSDTILRYNIGNYDDAPSMEIINNPKDYELFANSDFDKVILIDLDEELISLDEGQRTIRF